MDNKPPFKEFLLINHDAIIKSSNGHYYIRKQSQRFKIGRVSSFVLCSLLSIGIYLFVSRFNLWENIEFDIVLIIGLISYFILRIQYRRSTYEIVDHIIDDTEIFNDPPKTLTKNKFIVYMIIFGVMTLFSLLNSFSVMYIRSLFENPHNISDMFISFNVAEDAKDINFLKCENLSELSIPYTKVTSVDVIANISGSPSTYQLKLNGQILSDIHYRKLRSKIWDKEIFIQHCYGSFDADNLTNNSVLEISSGSYSRQWTIKLTE